MLRGEINFPEIARLSSFFQRPRDSHKGTYGTVLIVGGSLGMSGAAILAGNAALRSGAGLVQLAIPKEISSTVAIGNPCYTTIPLEDSQSPNCHDAIISKIVEKSRSADVVAIGPGWGYNSNHVEILDRLLAEIHLPIVLDADGLNALSQLPYDRLLHRTQSTILTPHPGEFARLTSLHIKEIQENRETISIDFAQNRGGILVLKGDQTLVTNGEELYRNQTGNPGMATGGSGDCLTGVLASLLAQGLPPFLASCFATFIHGLAGDLASEKLGEISMIASDIIQFLPEAFQITKRQLLP